MKKLNLLIGCFVAVILLSCGGKEKVEEAKVDATVETEIADISGTYQLAEGSQIMWEGNKLVGKGHNGTLDVTSGQFTVADGKISDGSFTLDMSSLKATDLADDPDSQAKLEGHLMSADFFNTEEFGQAMFKVTGSEKLAEGESATHKIMGDLTIKGITQPIEFLATVGETDNGISVASEFEVDRTRWEIKYGSDSSIENLAKDKVINDEMKIKFDLKAMK